MRQAEYDMGETRSALGVICSSYDEFFEAEKKIADFMMEHKAEVVDIDGGRVWPGPAGPATPLYPGFAGGAASKDSTA